MFYRDNESNNSMYLIYAIYALQGLNASVNGTNEQHIIASGLVLAMITCATIISKMSGEPLDQLAILFAMLSIFDNRLAIFLSIVYIMGTILEISQYMKRNIILPDVNVYCCGVFDMCHRGHMIMFRNAAKLGTKFIVGVHNDEAVASYKRIPIMTHDERCKTVAECKYVDEVIPHAELYVSEEFIKEHNISIVICCEDYFNNPNDKWYCKAREMGILKLVGYTADVSTSDIIKRIKERC